MTEWRTDKPPLDGTEILIPVDVEVRAYWDAEMKCFVLSYPLHIDVAHNVTRWRAP